MKQKHYKTIILSDLHLGSRACDIDKLLDFIKNVKCDLLILNGDVIDCWALWRYPKGWTDSHTSFIRQVLKKSQKDNTKIIYIRGNHDDIIRKILPIQFGDISIVDKYEHVAGDGEKYMLVHGDMFDGAINKLKILYLLGSAGYALLVRINRLYNKYRLAKGKKPYSLSKKIKSYVKKKVQYISDWENEAARYAEINKCDGIICGHIHTPCDKYINGVRYINSGDWVESCSAIVETDKGDLKVIYY